MRHCDARDIGRVLAKENWKKEVVHPTAEAFRVQSPLFLDPLGGPTNGSSQASRRPSILPRGVYVKEE